MINDDYDPTYPTWAHDDISLDNDDETLEHTHHPLHLKDILVQEMRWQQLQRHITQLRRKRMHNNKDIKEGEGRGVDHYQLTLIYPLTIIGRMIVNYWEGEVV